MNFSSRLPPSFIFFPSSPPSPLPRTLPTPPSRDRNREHARNTRLRKKAFLQKLQDLCENLTAQRNKEIEDRLALGKRIYLTV
jgi:hypothetical protein